MRTEADGRAEHALPRHVRRSETERGAAWGGRHGGTRRRAAAGESEPGERKPAGLQQRSSVHERRDSRTPCLTPQSEDGTKMRAGRVAAEGRNHPQPAVDAARRDPAEIRADVAAVCDAGTVTKEKPADDCRRNR